jgi:uncharacterized Zn finger protein
MRGRATRSIFVDMPRRRRTEVRHPADPRLVGLTEDALRGLVPPKIFARGDDYWERGTVVEIAWRGDVLHADVQGSDYDPYHIVVEARGDRLTAACDCPYMDEWGEGAWCKHVVAALLFALRSGEYVSQHPTVAELLATLDRDALVRLVETLVETAPGLYDVVAEAAEHDR